MSYHLSRPIQRPNLENSNITSTSRLISTWTLVKTLSIQLSGSYRGPQVSLQSKSKPLYSADLAVKKEFLENKLSLTFRVSDLFNTLKNSYTSWGDNYTADNWRKVESRVAYVSLSYNFGGGSKPKNSKSIENESEGNGGSEF